MKYVVNFLDGNGRDTFLLTRGSDEGAGRYFEEFVKDGMANKQLVWAQLARVDPPVVLQNVGPGPWLDDFDP